ncbi:LysR family transcriptional regulator [Bradyrhizobium yuanmingense]|uniref:LysR family transcriptional regulator n=1 Tax=Bradyrhizobium yuanmingense TaxID=108015 RepID=UPI00351203D8
MDRLDAMKVFVLAVDEGSLAAAGRKLGRSPAAVSRAIAFLEERVGAELLHRTTRSIKLSEEGERYVEVCRRVLTELEEAEDIATGARAAPRGLLTITAPVVSGEMVLRPILDAFLDTYRSRLDQIRRDHGHRAVAGLTKDRIEEKILKPLHNKPGAKIDTLKKLRILIRHAKDLKWLTADPSDGIKRGKSKEIRAWTDAELAAFEKRWPFGTKQRAAYELMLNVGTARVDTHLTTWIQADAEDFEYTRRKTGVPVLVEKADSLRQALAALPRKHVCILTTEYGKPFTVDGFSGWLRAAITSAGIADLSCQPHGLRKTFGRLLADAGATAHDIMAAVGHLTLADAERYTREADRRRGGRRAIVKLEDHKANRKPQTHSAGLGNVAKTQGISK